MAWENFKLEQQRLQVVQAYMQKKSSMACICREYGISRKTAYKWYQRFIEFGEEGLKDLSKAPHKRKVLYDNTQINKAIDLKLQRRTWGPKKVLAKLEELYPEDEWPSATRLYEIFKEHHLVVSKRLKRRVPATAPIGDLTGCNDTWSVDFKGWFFTQDGQKCEPLTITDCFTRYLIRCEHLTKHSVEYVWPIFKEVFQEYGLPNRVRSDNGAPFGSCGVGRLTPLSVNLIKVGVIPEWIEPGHPEQNGQHERFHLTLKQETANPPKDTLALQIQAMKDFQYEYNFERPHEALNMVAPAKNYRTSARKWDGKLKSPEYDTKFETRKVETGGQIKWRGQHIYISETLKSEYIGLLEDDNGDFKCFYGPIYLGKIGRSNTLEKPKPKMRRRK